MRILLWIFWTSCGLVLVAFTLLILLGAGGGHFRVTMSNADVAEYASSAHFTIADVHIQVPLVAVTDYRRLNPPTHSPDNRPKSDYAEEKRAFVSEASDPSTPSVKRELRIAIDSYGTHGEVAASSGICPKLRRRWATAVCADSRSPLQRALPRDFYLADANFIGQRAASKTRRDQLARMDVSSPVATYTCDPAPQDHHYICTAAVLIEGQLVAWWPFFATKGDESAPYKVEQQGQAIQALVRFGMSGEEDFPALLDAVCADGRCLSEFVSGSPP